MRCQNTNRKSNAIVSKPKKLKLTEKHDYALLTIDEDEISDKRNKELLFKEISKGKANVDVMRTLIHRTLGVRRKEVTSGVRPEELLKSYPHLKKPNYVSNIHNLNVIL